MELKHSSHGVYKNQYHVCWIPKYHRRILNPGVQGYIRKLFPKILRQMPGVEIQTVGIEKDHIHLVMVVLPRYAVSSVVGYLKQRLTNQLRKKFPWLKKVYWREKVIWSPGFFVSTIGLSEEEIKKYVEWQGRQDSGQIQLKL